MNNLQYRELLAIRGRECLHEGETIESFMRDSGGDPTPEEMALVNERVVPVYAKLLQRAEKDLIVTVDVNIRLQTEVEKLEKDSRFLNALQAAGVDNWDGYDQAIEILNKN